MAKLLPTPFIPPAYDLTADNFREQIEQSWKAVEAEGDTLEFPVADGAAVYIVRSISPPVLQWVKWLDAWQADPALIRGLRSSDVKLRLQRQKALASMFSK